MYYDLETRYEMRELLVTEKEVMDSKRAWEAKFLAKKGFKTMDEWMKAQVD